MSDTNNPRAVVGGNQPDFAVEETERLKIDYHAAMTLVGEMLEEARTLPKVIDDITTKQKYVSLIKRMRDHTKLLDSYHGAEKAPHFRRGQGVDQFFFGLWDRLARRDKKAKAGAADILNERLTEYDNRILAEEQEKRRKEAAEQARIAAAAEAERLRVEAEAEAARQAAERARKPENVAAHLSVADLKEAEASTARVEASLAANKAEETHVATLAKPADIMRTRFDDGSMSTMAKDNLAEIIDSAKLDKEKLWPFITEDAKEKALRAWAKTTSFKQEMDGAKIVSRQKSQVR